MTALTVFQYTDQAVRTVIIDGEPWFVAKDVCAALRIANTSDAIGRLDSDGVGTTDLIDSMGRQQTASTVNESGLYELVFQSRRPEARQFRRWVTSEVLPQIRKTGSYNGGAQLPQSLGQALALAAQVELERERLALEATLNAPKVEAFNAFMNADGSYSMEAAAKSLSDVTGGIGRNRLFAVLRERKVLMAGNTPYQTYAHWFDVRVGTYSDSEGVKHTTKTTLVRPAGLEGIRRLFSRSIAAA